jgi:hypothetical protein
MWGDEFASQLAQGLNLGTDAELERAWQASVRETRKKRCWRDLMYFATY